MNKEFKKEDWQDAAIMFVQMIDKHESGMHSIQVFKKDIDGGGYFPVEISVKDTGEQIILSVNNDPFDGYLVIR